MNALTVGLLILASLIALLLWLVFRGGWGRFKLIPVNERIPFILMRKESQTQARTADPSPLDLADPEHAELARWDNEGGRT